MPKWGLGLEHPIRSTLLQKLQSTLEVQPTAQKYMIRVDIKSLPSRMLIFPNNFNWIILQNSFLKLVLPLKNLTMNTTLSYPAYICILPHTTNQLLSDLTSKWQDIIDGDYFPAASHLYFVCPQRPQNTNYKQCHLACVRGSMWYKEKRRWLLAYITTMSHEPDYVSNHRQLDCVLKNKLPTNEWSVPIIASFTNAFSWHGIIIGTMISIVFFTKTGTGLPIYRC